MFAKLKKQVAESEKSSPVNASIDQTTDNRKASQETSVSNVDDNSNTLYATADDETKLSSTVLDTPKNTEAEKEKDKEGNNYPAETSSNAIAPLVDIATPGTDSTPAKISISSSQQAGGDTRAFHSTPVSHDIKYNELVQSRKKLKAELQRYKVQVSKLNTAYSTLQADKERIEQTLVQNQDKAFKRIAEMKEAHQLDQLAKKHLDESMQSTLQEKDDLIRVLQQQVALLKQTTNSLSQEAENDLNDSNKMQGIAKGLAQYDQLREEVDRLKESFTIEKEMLQKKIEDLNANIDTLEKQKRTAIQDLNGRMQDAVTAKQSELLETQEILENNQTMVTNLKIEADKLLRQKNSFRDQLDAAQKAIKDLKESSRVEQLELREKLNKCMTEQEAEKEELLQNLKKDKSAVIDLMNKDKQEMISRLVKENEMNAENREKVFQAALKTKDKEMESELIKKDAEFKEIIKKKNDEMERAIDSKNDEIKDFIKKLKNEELQRQSVIQDSQKQIELALKEKQEIMQVLKRSETSLEQEQARVEELIQQHNNQLKEKQEENHKNIIKLKKSLQAKLNEVNSQNHAKVTELQKTIDDLKMQLLDVESKHHSSLTDYENKRQKQVEILKADYENRIEKIKEMMSMEQSEKLNTQEEFVKTEIKRDYDEKLLSLQNKLDISMNNAASSEKLLQEMKDRNKSLNGEVEALKVALDKEENNRRQLLADQELMIQSLREEHSRTEQSIKEDLEAKLDETKNYFDQLLNTKDNDYAKQLALSLEKYDNHIKDLKETNKINTTAEVDTATTQLRESHQVALSNLEEYYRSQIQHIEDSYKSELTSASSSIERLTTEHKLQLSDMEKKSKDSEAALRDELEERIKFMEKEHNQKLKDMEEEYNVKAAESTQSHQATLSEVKENFKSKIDSYKRKLELKYNAAQASNESLKSEHDQELSKLMQQHENDKVSLRSEFDDKIERIKLDYEKKLTEAEERHNQNINCLQESVKENQVIVNKLENNSKQSAQFFQSISDTVKVYLQDTKTTLHKLKLDYGSVIKVDADAISINVDTDIELNNIAQVIQSLRQHSLENLVALGSFHERVVKEKETEFKEQIAKQELEYKTQLEVVNKSLRNVNGVVTALQEELLDTKKSNSDNIRSIQEACDQKTLEAVNTEKEQIKALKKRYEDEIDEIKQSQRVTVNQVREEHQKIINDLKAQYDIQIQSSHDQLRELQEAYDQLSLTMLDKDKNYASQQDEQQTKFNIHIKEVHADYKNQIQKAVDSYEKRLVDVNDQLQQLYRKKTEVEKASTVAASELEGHVQMMKVNLDKNQEILKSKDQEITTLVSKNQSLIKEIEVLKGEVHISTSKMQEALIDSEAKHSEIQAKYGKEIELLEASKVELESTVENQAKKIEIFQKSIEEDFVEISSKEKVILSITKELEETRSKLKASELYVLDKIKEHENEVDGLKKKFKSAYQSKIRELNDDFKKTLSKTEQEHQVNIENLQKNTADELKDMQLKSTNSYELKLNEHTATIERFREEINQLQNERVKLIETIDELGGNNNQLSKKVREINKKYEELQQQLADAKNKYTAEGHDNEMAVKELEVELDSAKDEVEKLRQVNNELENKIVILTEDSHSKEIKVKDIMKEKEDIASELRRAEESSSDAEKLRLTMLTNIEILQRDKTAAESDLISMQEQLEQACSDREMISKRLELLESGKRETEKQITDDYQIKLDDAQLELSRLKMQLTNKDIELESITKQHQDNQLNAEVLHRNELKQQEIDAEKKIDEYRNNIKLLESEIDSLKQEVKEAKIHYDESIILRLSDAKKDHNTALALKGEEIANLKSQRLQLQQDHFDQIEKVTKDYEIKLADSMKANESKDEELDNYKKMLENKKAIHAAQVDVFKRQLDELTDKEQTTKEQANKLDDLQQQLNERTLQYEKDLQEREFKYQRDYEKYKQDIDEQLLAKEAEFDANMKHAMKEFHRKLEQKEIETINTIDKANAENEKRCHEITQQHQTHISRLEKHVTDQQEKLDDLIKENNDHRIVLKTRKSEHEDQIANLNSRVEELEYQLQQAQNDILNNPVENLNQENELLNKKDKSRLAQLEEENENLKLRLQQRVNAEEGFAQNASVNSSFSEVNQRFFGDSPQSFYGKNAYYNDNMEERSFSSDGAPLSPSKDSPPSVAEFEYLRNALFQYMVGRERLQMSKVLVALARFTSSQSQKILAKEQERDKNKSWLG